MNPDEKYMSQSSSWSRDKNDIKFVPPAFMNRNFNENIDSSGNNYNLDLFPSETGLPELCYYSDELDDKFSRSSNYNIANHTIPSTFDVLRHLDLDLDETNDLERGNSDNDVNKIYAKIERRHPGIFATLYSYRIPRPIVRVIIKRLIRLTLLYSNKDYKK
ncbi:hypothetical protein [Clostridium sp.]|uniref:hypothetical protein n=1 Tax=Clostridium sp. TaxID=1506 RepID=UPI0026216007|nr:hypothetical protein [Clostridium sp.]